MVAVGAWFLVGFLRVVVVTERRPREGKLVHDLLAGLIYLAAVFAIIAYVFDLPIQGLLATSGAIAIILGLALQSTLSDVFSGIVLNFSRPYRPGDWISIDGSTDGRVIEMNWRATHVLTGTSDLAIVPNSTIAKAKIVNTSSPSSIHSMSVTVQLDPKTYPSTGAEILRHAILNTQPILATPSPSVGVKSITADAIEFDLNFSVEELGQSTHAQNDLFDRLYRHLAAAGINWASTASRPSWLAEASLPLGAQAAHRTLAICHHWRAIGRHDPASGKLTNLWRIISLLARRSLLASTKRGLPVDDPRWREPVADVAPMPTKRMGPPPGASPPMRMTASWSGSKRTCRIQILCSGGGKLW